MEEAAAGKDRLPTVESLMDGTIKRLVAAERRVQTLRSAGCHKYVRSFILHNLQLLSVRRCA